MIICVKCKKEMKCEKNGVTARFGEAHNYSGDKFICNCGIEIIDANSKPYHSFHLLNENDLQMNVED